MSVTAADVQAMGPDLAAVQEATIEIYLSIAEEMISESVFGTKYENALKSLTAHLVTLNVIRSGNSGAVTSEKVGDLARSYAQADADKLLSQTSYGEMFLMLRRLCVVGPRCV